MMKNDIKLFEKYKIRSSYDEKKDIWYFSVIDVIAILTDSTEPRRYWSDLKRKVALEAGNTELYDKIVQLKMIAPDGKMRNTDAADVQTMFRIIQSIPSPKAEPVKQWLARVGYERIKETADPALSLNRARENWQRLGRSDKWIGQRMMGQETRNKLTDYWKDHEITKEEQYALLTNIIHREWAGVSVKEHKRLKGLKSQNLRDHMSEAELIFTALAELSTRQVAENNEATGLEENKVAAKIGGNISKKAREDFEKRTGRQVVTGENYLLAKKEIKKIREIKNNK